MSETRGRTLALRHSGPAVDHAPNKHVEEMGESAKDIMDVGRPEHDVAQRLEGSPPADNPAELICAEEMRSYMINRHQQLDPAETPAWLGTLVKRFEGGQNRVESSLQAQGTRVNKLGGLMVEAGVLEGRMATMARKQALKGEEQTKEKDKMWPREEHCKRPKNA